MSIHATLDVNEAGDEATVGVIISGDDAQPETISLVCRALTRAGATVSMQDGSSVLFPYSSGTDSHRAVVEEWTASQP